MLLLERNDVNPNIADRYGETALLIAACEEHEQAVKNLLRCNDANPNTAESSGKPPLSLWPPGEDVRES